MTSQRVVFYTPQFWPQVGIDQMALIDLADAFSHHDCAVSIVTRQFHPLWPTQLHFRDSQLVRVPRPLRGPWRGRRFSTHLRRQIESLLPSQAAGSTALVAVGIDPEIATLRQIALKQGLPLVVIAGREVTQRMAQSKTLPRAWRPLLEAPTRVVTTCPAAAEWLQAAGGDSLRVHWLQPVVGRLWHPQEKVNRRASRQRLGRIHPFLDASDDQKVALTITEMDGDPGFHTMLQAWRHVLQVYPQARLWVVGDGPELGPIHYHLQRLQIDHSVFLAGCFDDWSDLIAAADLYLHAAHWRGDSLPLRLALAQGCCAIATTSWDHRAAAVPQSTRYEQRQSQAPCLTVPRHADSELFASAIIDLFRDASRAEQIQRDGLAWSEANGSRSIAVAEWMRVLAPQHAYVAGAPA